MSANKTKPTTADVKAFLDKAEPARRREDAYVVLEMMERVTGEKPVMWGPTMVGFGTYHYKYATGREGDWLVTGFSPRKANLTIYIMSGFSKYDALMSKLGKYKTGKSCLYINKLDDIDRKVLEKLVAESVKHIRKTYG